MALEKLITKVEADISGLSKGLSEGKKQISSYERDTTAMLKGAAAGIGSMAITAVKAITLAAAAAAIPIIALTKRSLENADALAKQSDMLGITTEKLVAYNLAAELGGSSTEGMTKALATLNTNLRNTGSETGPAINALRQLGLTSAELQRMGLEASFELLADKISKVQDPMARLGIATELFGKEGKALLPVLLEGSAGFEEAARKAEALGIAISRVDAAQIEQANDAVSVLGMAFEGIGNTIAIKMAPALQFAAEAVTDLIVRNDGFRDSIEKGVELGVKGFGYLLLAVNRVEMGFRAIQLTWTTVYLKIIEGINWVDEATKKAANSIRSVFGLEEIDTTAGLKAHADEVAGSVQGIVDRMMELENTKPNVDAIVEEFERIKAKSMETATQIANMRSGVNAEGEVQDVDKIKESQDKYKQIEQEFSDSLTEIWNDGLLRRQVFNKQSWDVQASDVAGSLGKMLGSVSTTSKSMFRLNQMAAIANAIINTAQGVTKALSAYPPPLSFAMAAAQAAAGFAQVNAIRSATFGGGGSSPTPSGGSAVSSSSGAATNLTNPNAVGNTAADMTAQGLRDVNISVQGFQITTEQFRDIVQGLNEVIDDGGRIGQINVVGGTRL